MRGKKTKRLRWEKFGTLMLRSDCNLGVRPGRKHGGPCSGKFPYPPSMTEKEYLNVLTIDIETLRAAANERADERS